MEGPPETRGIVAVRYDGKDVKGNIHKDKGKPCIDDGRVLRCAFDPAGYGSVFFRPEQKLPIMVHNTAMSAHALSYDDGHA